ncbi:hypothetical protein MRX96_046378 [Rhipicephalus microplus]
MLPLLLRKFCYNADTSMRGDAQGKYLAVHKASAILHGFGESAGRDLYLGRGVDDAAREGYPPPAVTRARMKRARHGNLAVVESLIQKQQQYTTHEQRQARRGLRRRSEVARNFSTEPSPCELCRGLP